MASAVSEDAESTSPELAPEQRQVLRWRYELATSAGLTSVEARLFAESDQETSTLRSCIENGWSPEQIRAIVL